MTRKDYILITHIFKENKPEGAGEGLDRWYVLAKAIGEALKDDNRDFDQPAFYRNVGADNLL